MIDLPRVLLIAAATTALGGCASTSEPVLQLAEKSSANAGVVSARLRQLGEASDALYANRRPAHRHTTSAKSRSSERK